MLEWPQFEQFAAQFKPASSPGLPGRACDRLRLRRQVAVVSCLYTVVCIDLTGPLGYLTPNVNNKVFNGLSNGLSRCGAELI